MAIVEEDYGNNKGDERSIARSFLVHQAKDELDAMASTRAYLVANDQMYWPAWDGGPVLPAGITGVNELMYASNVSFVELHQAHQPNLSPAPTPAGEYRTVVTYLYRALCPVVDYNLSTVTQKVTQANSSRYFNRDDPDSDPDPNLRKPKNWPSDVGGPQSTNYNGAIELTEDKGKAVGADGFFPQTQFSLVWNPFLRSKFTTEVHEYARNVARMVGKTNLTDFLADSADNFAGYEAESLIFLGWTGKVIDQRNDLYEYRYQFGYREFYDADGKTIGGISIPAGNMIGGWEHAWVTWIPEKKSTTGTPIKEYKAPKAQQLNFDKYLEPTEFYDLFKEKANPANQYLITRLCPGFADAP